MSYNKKPAFFVAIALGALICLPVLFWLGSQLFTSGNGPVEVPPANSSSAGARPAAGTADFALRKLATRARSLIDGEIAEAARAGDVSLDTVMALRRNLDKADSALANGNRQKAAKIYEEIAGQAEQTLGVLEQADKAREMLDKTYQRLGAMEPLKNAFAKSYAEAVTAFDQGQQQLGEGLYAESIDSLSMAGAVLDDLEARSVQQVQTLLEQAARAVDAYDIGAARSAYRSVLEISPAQPDALAGLALVDSLQGIASEVQALDALEEAGRLEEALGTVRELLAAKPQNAYLLSRQQAIAGKITQRDFSARIAEADKAEAAGDLSAAVSALESALQVKTDAAVSARLETIKERIKAARLETLLADGYNALQAGRYQAARDAYKSAVDLAPASREARTGYEKASGLLLAGIRYSQNMTNAAKYIEAGRYPLAAKFFNKAMSARPARLDAAQEKKEASIRQTIERESQPVDIRLASDGRTYVSMTGVFPPEKIKTKELSLFPDVYKIKGTRKGYRTIEKSIRIDSSNAAEAITVECTERE